MKLKIDAGRHTRAMLGGSCAGPARNRFQPLSSRRSALGLERIAYAIVRESGLDATVPVALSYYERQRSRELNYLRDLLPQLRVRPPRAAGEPLL